jgi:hypothetical protein
LLTDNRHDLDGLPINPIINVVRATHAAPVSCANIVNRRRKQRLFCKLLEAIKKGVVILVGLPFPVLLKPTAINTF